MGRLPTLLPHCPPLLLPIPACMALRRTTALLQQLRNTPSMSLKPIICYTAGTPNGHKVHIMIEELKLAYGDKTGFSAEYKNIELSSNAQKEDCEWV